MEASIQYIGITHLKTQLISFSFSLKFVNGTGVLVPLTKKGITSSLFIIDSLEYWIYGTIFYKIYQSNLHFWPYYSEKDQYLYHFSNELPK